MLRFVLDAVRAETFNDARTLFLFGSYTIGKERLFLEVARQMGKKVRDGPLGTMDSKRRVGFEYLPERHELQSLECSWHPSCADAVKADGAISPQSERQVAG